MTRHAPTRAPNPPDAGRGQRVPKGAIALTAAAALVLCAAELLLTAADAGAFGPGPWRYLALSYGAFWNGLLTDWRSNYPGQPVAMFLTYALLHADLSHLAGNVLTMGYLAPALARRIGTGAAALAFLAAIPGGSIGFALLSDALVPMVGASGAVFGLAGAWLRADLSVLRAEGRPVRPVILGVAWLMAINLALWWILDGALAWETHAGGFAAGWLACALVHRRRGAP